MTAFFQTFISLAAVWAQCAAFARAVRCNGALAALPVMGFTMLWFSFAGCLGLLRAAGYVYFAVAAGAAVYLALQRKGAQWKTIFSPGLVLFMVLGLAALTVFSIRRPILQEWDEFSFWGTAAKAVSTHNALWTSGSTDAFVGWPWPQTQKPGFVVISYFFNFFGSFAPWRMYLGYDVCLFAVVAALVGVMGYRRWYAAVPMTLLGLLLPYFTVYTRLIYFDPTYVSSYADIPMGMLFGGIFAYYYASRQGKAPWWGVLPLLGMVTMCKDTGLALACVAAMCVFMDMLLCQPVPEGQKRFGRKTLLPKLGAFAAMYGTVGACFTAWSKYLSLQGAAQGTVGGSSDLSYFGMLFNGVKMLFGLAPSPAAAPYAEKFIQIRNEMIRMLFSTVDGRITMVGPGVAVIALVWLILGAVCVLCTDKAHRRRTLLYGVCSTLGFFAYYAFIGFTYVFVFKEPGTGSIMSYNRYINTYYVGWLAGAFALLGLGVLLGSRWRNALCGVLLAGSICFLGRFTQLVMPQLCVIDYPDVVYREYALQHTRSQAVKNAMPPDSRVYYVNWDDNGEKWFRNSYELLPDVLTYSHGGGIFYLYTDSLIPIDEWAGELASQKCDYIYIEDTTDDFFEYYGALFSDGGKAWYSGETVLYKVTVRGDAALQPVLVNAGARYPDGKKVPYLQTPQGNHAVYKDGTPRYVLPNAVQNLTLTPVAMEEVPLLD